VDYTLEINSTAYKNRLNEIVINILKHTHIFENIEYVLVQGDTTTALAMALSAFHHNKKVIHLEAGLRTHNIEDPFPEEANRQMISRLAQIHLCPTELNKQNLLEEGIKESNIFVVGNTGLDNIDRSNCVYENKVLITLHRRNNLPIMDRWFMTKSGNTKTHAPSKTCKNNTTSESYGFDRDNENNQMYHIGQWRNTRRSEFFK
jgi:UDP-N-acetylglucosamine 2-epimerase